MEPLEIDLEVGETLTLGDYKLTLLDIDGQDVAVQIESPDDFSFEQDVLNNYRPLFSMVREGEAQSEPRPGEDVLSNQTFHRPLL